MGKFFTRERFGRPQVSAGLLLLAFMGQCFWLLLAHTQREAVDSSLLFRVEEGLSQWRGESIAGTASTNRIEAGTFPPTEVEQNEGYDPDHSPLWYLLAAAPLLGWHPPDVNTPLYWGWLERLPYIVFGVLLGASVWYVARRLYGNAGGYVALALYSFSPAILRSSTLWFAEPEMAAAWGTFGAIFTAIAVAHTLYAPREVVVWNWRRILLLGLSLVLAVGCQFSLVVLVPLALAFMLYVAPTRRKAAIVIWLAAGLVALLLLFAAYAFRSAWFWQGVRHARFFQITWQAFTTRWAYQRMLGQIGQAGPALLVMFPATLIVYFVWPRSRYFGNTAPLLVAGLFLVLGLGMPHYAGEGFFLMAVPFLFVFVAGIAADLLETPQRGAVLACIWGLVVANALWNLMELARVGRG
jgi:diadenosine tetraphosphatase ApaH/serine/threonine PP2A family protein phosphatase